MDDFLHALTLSDIDLEDLIMAIEVTLDAKGPCDDEENPLADELKNLESLHDRLLAVLSRG